MKMILDSMVKDLNRAMEDLEKYGAVLDRTGKEMTPMQVTAEFFPNGMNYIANGDILVSRLPSIRGCNRYFFYNFQTRAACAVVENLRTGEDVRECSRGVPWAIGDILRYLGIISY